MIETTDDGIAVNEPSIDAGMIFRRNEHGDWRITVRGDLIPSPRKKETVKVVITEELLYELVTQLHVGIKGGRWKKESEIQIDYREDPYDTLSKLRKAIANSYGLHGMEADNLLDEFDTIIEEAQ